MNILNCTPHPINFEASNGDVTEFPYSGIVPRVSMEYTEMDVDGILFSRPKYGEVIGLPKYEEGTYLIVSRMLATACNRSDLIVPCKFKRDHNGAIQSCKSFQVMS